MEEKNAKSSVTSWVFIGIAFIGVILFLLIKLLIEGKENARVQNQDRMIMYTSSWAENVGTEVAIANQFADMIKGMKINGNVFAGRNMVDFAADIVEKTDFAHVLFLKQGKVVADETGDVENGKDYSDIVSDGEAVHFLKEGEGYCRESSLSYTMDFGGNCHVMILIHSDEIAARFKSSSYEDASFLALVDKEGNILALFDKYKDTDSMFVRDSNILVPIMQNADRSDYNIFKVKLINGLDSAIEVTYNGDERTIVFSPTGIQGTYIVYGVRQNVVNKQIKSLFGTVQSTVIKLAILMLLFSVFVISSLVFTALRSKERGKELEDKADTDLLTELNNKAATERKIQEYISENPDGRALMFILDIDNFKKINDTMGHSFGDTLLRTLGKEIKMEFRMTDIVGRTGGDEFMVFLKDVQDDLIVEREANRISQFFHDFKAGGDYVKYSASASIGAAIYPDDAKTFKSLYVAADQALYRAKKRGKNQLVFFNESEHKI